MGALIFWGFIIVGIVALFDKCGTKTSGSITAKTIRYNKKTCPHAFHHVEGGFGGPSTGYSVCNSCGLRWKTDNPPKSLVRSKSVECNHNWSFDHKGGDKKYPRIFYKCSKCGVSGVAENYGDSIRKL